MVNEGDVIKTFDCARRLYEFAPPPPPPPPRRLEIFTFLSPVVMGSVVVLLAVVLCRVWLVSCVEDVELAPPPPLIVGLH